MSRAVSLLSLFAPLSLHAAIVGIPTITNSATRYSGAFDATNLFDGNRDTEYASAGGGAGDAFSTSNGTWVEMDFGSTVTVDRFFAMTRNNSGDVVGVSRLILSNDAVFDNSDNIITINPTGSNGAGPGQSFAQTSFRYARWEAGTSLGPAQNLGAAEMRFLNTAAGSALVTTTSVIGGSAAHASNPTNYALANAADGGFGRDASAQEYASNGAGDSLFVDFDLGSVMEVNGFDLFQRGTTGTSDRFTDFDLIFSNVSDFSSTVATTSHTINGFHADEMFSSINARYVRLDVTTGGTGNTGIVEMNFYQAVPEPATASLLGLGGVILLLRRRKN